MRTVFVLPSLGLLIGIGLLDLVVTAVLHAQGLIVELNPLMRVFIERSEWLFALVKGATLLAAFVVMRKHAKKNPEFVRSACLWGSAAYISIWSFWFMSGLQLN